jgi:hypothetical protein
MKIKDKDLKIKQINAVDLKNRIQAELYEETKSLSLHELIDYYRKQAQKGPFKKKQIA